MSWLGWHRLPVLALVYVTCKDRSTISGALVSARGRWVVLRGADILEPEHQHVDGDLFVPREHVAFIQVPPPPRPS